MAIKKKQTYEDILKIATYEYLEIQTNYWSQLIDRYTEWKDYVKLSEAKANLRLVNQYKAQYEQNFLDKFKEYAPYMAQAVNIHMVKDYLREYASTNALFNPHPDLFQDYLLAKQIIKMEDIEL